MSDFDQNLLEKVIPSPGIKSRKISSNPGIDTASDPCKRLASLLEIRVDIMIIVQLGLETDN